MIDTELRAVIEENLSVILNYDPYKKFERIKTTADFSALLRRDLAFAPFFLYMNKRLHLIFLCKICLGFFYQQS